MGDMVNNLVVYSGVKNFLKEVNYDGDFGIMFVELWVFMEFRFIDVL